MDFLVLSKFSLKTIVVYALPEFELENGFHEVVKPPALRVRRPAQLVGRKLQLDVANAIEYLAVGQVVSRAYELGIIAFV